MISLMSILFSFGQLCLGGGPSSRSTPTKPQTEWNQLFGLPFKGQKS